MAAPIRACSIGGIAENFDSSYRVGGGREFVIEGDEYDSAFFDKTAKFLKYLPDIAVVGNIEFDHADIYADLDAIRLTFQRFVNLIPRRGLLLLGADNAGCAGAPARAHCRVETFGLGTAPTGRRTTSRWRRRRRAFSVRRRGDPAGTFELPLLGTYNVRNALAAIAVGAAVGVTRDTMAASLRRFKGVRRRLQHRGTARGVAVYDDFAHHPTAIAETLAGVRSAYPGRRVWADLRAAVGDLVPPVFQSDFVRRCRGQTSVMLPAVFRSTLPEDQRLSPEQIVGELKAPASTPGSSRRRTTSSAPSRARARDGDLVVIMSNGGFDDIHQKLLDALAERSRCSSSDRPPAGDAALVVDLPERIDPTAQRVVRRAGGCAAEAGSARRCAMSVVGYCSVTVYFDPLLVDAAWLEDEVRGDCRGSGGSSRQRRRGCRCSGLLRRGVWAGPD